MSTFSQLNLHPKINQALKICGYVNPTPIQANSIPSILEGQDLVASAQTGTGKTAAFVLPALHRLAAKSGKKTRILILTPTRELASQITKAANTYGKFLNFNIISLVGGMPYHHQIRDLARGADIVVATPGRLIDHINSKRIDLSAVEMLILDEADRMLDMGFVEDVEFIAQITPAQRQTLLFSATVDKKLMTVVKHLLKNPIRIDLSDKKLTAPQIKQELYKTSTQHHKMRLLKQLLQDENIFKAIIFSATKINADKLAAQLSDQGFAAAALHGDLRQSVRNRTVENLRRGTIQFLVATDVAARGIDIADLTHIINYDLPKFCEDYVHRIGRTGRAGKDGVAISFVLPTEMRNLQRIERYIGQRFKLIPYTDKGDHVEKTHEHRYESNSNSRHEHRKHHYSDKEDHSNKKRDRGQFAKKDHYKDKEDHGSKRHDRGQFTKKDHYKDKEDNSGKRHDRGQFAKKDRYKDKEDHSGKRRDRGQFAKKDHKKDATVHAERTSKHAKKRFDTKSSNQKSDSKNHSHRNETRYSNNKPVKKFRKKNIAENN